MLQITTGKLFSRPVQRENLMRGVLYTNLRIYDDSGKGIGSDKVGYLVGSSELSADPRILLYQFTERIEQTANGSQFLISLGAEPYLSDMAVLISFALDCTCSPEVDLVRRLTSSKRVGPSRQVPSRLIRRTFDESIYLNVHEAVGFVRFAERVIGLQRGKYLGVMKAIRTFVTAMHRIADDLELAYTLLVAAGESLTQEFDEFTSNWDSIAQQKRAVFDEALSTATPEVAERVRDAIVKVEHVALGRRFQAFVNSHVTDEYFRRVLPPHSSPVGRSELPEVLAAAYELRSKYVHELEKLPDIVSDNGFQFETTLIDRRRMLTLQGLSNLMRHVIMTFVERQPSVEAEPYDYVWEMAGVRKAMLAPSAWVGHVVADLHMHGRDKLEGFLDEFARALLKEPDAKVTDLTHVLLEFNRTSGSMKAVHRRPFLAMFVIFSRIAGDRKLERSTKLEKLIQQDLTAPSPEALVSLAYFQEAPVWPLDEHLNELRKYKKKRANPGGIRFHRLFEAAISLEIAERFRAIGSLDEFRTILSDAADDYPDHTRLREFADMADPSSVVDWREVLLPKIQANENGSNLCEQVPLVVPLSRIRKVRATVPTRKFAKVRGRKMPAGAGRK